MYLSTRTQRGLSVSARTVTCDVASWRSDRRSHRMWIENLDRAVWLRVRACPTS